MTNVRKALLTSLVLLIIGIAGVSFLTSFQQKKDDIREKTEAARTLISQSIQHVNMRDALLTEKEQLMEEVQSAEARFYREDEIDEYSFGLELISLFQSMDLTVVQYHTVMEKEHTLLEYTLNGSIVNTLTLLKAISGNEKYWNIDFLYIKMRPDNRTADITLRIGYETIS